MAIRLSNELIPGSDFYHSQNQQNDMKHKHQDHFPNFSDIVALIAFVILMIAAALIGIEVFVI